MVPKNISIEDEHFCEFEILPLILQAFGEGKEIIYINSDYSTVL